MIFILGQRNVDQTLAGIARRKTSPCKATWPGRKQVWRQYDSKGLLAGDLVSTEDAAPDGTPLIQPVMQRGRRLAPSPSLDTIRAHARRELERLPPTLRSLEHGPEYAVRVGPELRALAEEVDSRIASAP